MDINLSLGTKFKTLSVESFLVYICKMNLTTVSRELKDSLLSVYGNQFSKLVLFGSYARAEQQDDSDIDFLVVLKGETVNPFKEIALANPVLSGFLFRYGKVFSLVATSEERFSNYNSSFFHHVRSEGIEI